MTPDGEHTAQHEEVPAEAYLLALSMLPDMGPARLRALVTGRPAEQAWAEVADGRAHLGIAGPLLGARPAEVAERWAASATPLDPARVLTRHVTAGVQTMAMGTAGFPEELATDLEPPSVLTAIGDLDALAGPRVAVVGTRDCTRYGRDVAFELGGDLSASGVRVISGLALGIDGAAHAGAVDAGGAPPIAIVGTGLDVAYPKRNESLWRRVAERGVILSEYPLGSPPTAWHFPARNRLIAALADVVVVVESHENGGAMLTVEEALRRDVEVMAVPGSVRSLSSRGTNKLLFDGTNVCRDAADVLCLLGLDSSATDRRQRSRTERPLPADDDAVVLAAIGWEPIGLEQLLAATGLELADVAGPLARLEAEGWVARRGGWIERCADGPAEMPG